jgi:hypothetical protein
VAEVAQEKCLTLSAQSADAKQRFLSNPKMTGLYIAATVSQKEDSFLIIASLRGYIFYRCILVFLFAQDPVYVIKIGTILLPSSKHS